MENIKKKSLMNIKNYKKSMPSVYDSSLIYKDIINEYVIHMLEHSKIDDTFYFFYIFSKGLQSIKHIFMILLMYTKNLELTYYHCKKAYLYYLEFISQIGNENHSYLQLNSKDAILFIYKKTIFDVNSDFIKTFQLSDINNIKIDLIKYNCDFVNKMFSYAIKCNFNKIMILKEELLKKQKKKIMSMFTNFIKILDLKNPKNIYKNFYTFIDNISTYNMEYKKFFEITDLYVKKIINNENCDFKKITDKMSSDTLFNKLETNTSNKFVKWLCDH